MPPSYATQAPSIFDSGLPKITMEDFMKLKEQCPQLTENLCIPDVNAITNFFMNRSLVKNETDRVDEAVEEKLVQFVNEVGLEGNLERSLKAIEAAGASGVTPHGLPHLKDIDKYVDCLLISVSLLYFMLLFLINCCASSRTISVLSVDRKSYLKYSADFIIIYLKAMRLQQLYNTNIEAKYDSVYSLYYLPLQYLNYLRAVSETAHKFINLNFESKVPTEHLL